MTVRPERMDKFYVKPKRGLKAAQTPGGNLVATSRKSPDVNPATVSSRPTGVGKFYSKIRHTIEDNLTPKISGKLYKAGKHSKSMTALSSLDSSMGKYTLTNKNSQPLETKAEAKEFRAKAAKTVSLSTTSPSDNTPSISSYFAQRPSSYVESDEDETQLSLNLVKTSLEDEIFEELEKVAHDESKLNAVLKTFDKIVFDYNDPLLQTTSSDKVQDEKKPLGDTLNIGLTTAEEPMQTLTNPTPDKASSDKTSTNEELPGPQPPNPNPKQTDCRHHTDTQKLQKSSSCLSLTRRKLYQSPDSPCLRQMQHNFIQQQKRKSTSVWELTNSTKIPILKTLPLQKRSKSFSYLNTSSPFHSGEETSAIGSAKSAKAATAEEEDSGLKKSAATKRMNRTAKYVNVRPSVRSSDTSLNGTAVRVGKDTQAKRGTGEQNSAAPKRTNSNSSLSTRKNISAGSSAAPITPPRRSRTSDELLDKCLEKGQQILRKVESLNTQQRPKCLAVSSNNKSVVRIKSSGGGKNSTLRRKRFQPKLNYANEDKISPPSLESCKIIPPDFTANANKHAELLVNVVQVSSALRPLPQRQVSTDSGIAAVSAINSLDSVPSPLSLKTKETESSCSDSDDSGHISNENMEVTNNHQPSNASSITSLNDDSAVVGKDDGDGDYTAGGDSPRQLLITTNQRVCTTCRIAQVESVQVIRTHVEIFPNFTKEVTIRLQ